MFLLMIFIYKRDNTNENYVSIYINIWKIDMPVYNEATANIKCYLLCSS